LAAFFKKAEMVIVPSWYEGLGLAAIEAQYLGVPLAVSDTTGLNEVVEDGKNGLTFEPRNSQSLANAMIKILRNEVDVPSMVRAAKKTVRVFSLDRHIVDLESAYKELIEKHRK
jgi:glycosyltransferase involved in cell wall biosynthesis